MAGGARYVYGKNSVKAVLDTHPDRVFKIFMADNLKPDKRLQAIQETAHNYRIPVQQVPRQKLDQMLRGQEPSPESGPEEFVSHQGVLASVAPKDLLGLHELIQHCKARIEAGQHPRLLLLDGVTDPRNFGA